MVKCHIVICQCASIDAGGGAPDRAHRVCARFDPLRGKSPRRLIFPSAGTWRRGQRGLMGGGSQNALTGLRATAPGADAGCLSKAPGRTRPEQRRRPVNVRRDETTAAEIRTQTPPPPPGRRPHSHSRRALRVVRAPLLLVYHFRAGIWPGGSGGMLSD